MKEDEAGRLLLRSRLAGLAPMAARDLEERLMGDTSGQLTEALISGYLDEVICPNDRRRVQEHLQRCAGCRRLLRDLRELRDTLLTARRYLHLPGSVPISSAAAGYALPCRPCR